MSAVIKVLEREIKKKQKRLDHLESLMSKNHLSSDDIAAHDKLAVKINAENDMDKKLKLMNKLKPINDRILIQLKADKHQSDNYIKWMNEQFKIETEIHEISNELFCQKIRMGKQ